MMDADVVINQSILVDEQCRGILCYLRTSLLVGRTLDDDSTRVATVAGKFAAGKGTCCAVRHDDGAGCFSNPVLTELAVGLIVAGFLLAADTIAPRIVRLVRIGIVCGVAHRVVGDCTVFDFDFAAINNYRSCIGNFTFGNKVLQRCAIKGQFAALAHLNEQTVGGICGSGKSIATKGVSTYTCFRLAGNRKT